MASREEELQSLKRQVVENLEKSRKRSFRSSTALIAMVLITASSIVYAFIQQTQAVKAGNEAIANAAEAQKQRIFADKNALMAQDTEKEAALQMALAAEALKKCEESKKKK